MKNYICNSKKYTGGSSYISLPIDSPDLPKEIVVDGISLSLKEELHVSLFCVKNVLSKYKNLTEEEIEKAFCEFISSNDISFLKYTGEFKIASFEERKSVVGLCEISNLEKLFKHMREKLNIEINTQPTHVTLYTLQSNKGIGLNNQNDIEEKTSEIEVGEEVKGKLINIPK